jgi:NhaP-type Na+/H+ or K+/H+ antiporter
VVASSIVAGGVAERNLPSSLRCAISAESGFNDGLALPFVVLPVAGTHRAARGSARTLADPHGLV